MQNHARRLVISYFVLPAAPELVAAWRARAAAAAAEGDWDRKARAPVSMRRSTRVVSARVLPMDRPLVAEQPGSAVVCVCGSFGKRCAWVHHHLMHACMMHMYERVSYRSTWIGADCLCVSEGRVCSSSSQLAASYLIDVLEEGRRDEAPGCWLLLCAKVIKKSYRYGLRHLLEVSPPPPPFDADIALLARPPYVFFS